VAEKGIDLIYPSLNALWKVETDFTIIKVIPSSSRPPRVHFDLDGRHRITVSQDSSGSFVGLSLRTPDGDVSEDDFFHFRANKAGRCKELSVGGKVVCKVTQLLNKRPSYS
jgi:hypothetical protein